MARQHALGEGFELLEFFFEGGEKLWEIATRRGQKNYNKNAFVLWIKL